MINTGEKRVMKSRVAWLTINRGCNIACTWCYQGKLLESKEEMPFGLATQLMDISSGVGVKRMVLLGGEPTIHPDFLKIVEYGSRRFDTNLLTNGITFANKDFCQKVEDAGLHTVSTSLKGISEEEYSRNCGKSSFGRVMKGIENLERSALKHHVSITVCRTTIENWGKIAGIMRECGARDFTFSFERPVIEGDSSRMDEEMLPSKVVNFIEDVMYPSLKETGLDFDINLTIPHCLFSPGFVDMVRDEGHALGGCQLVMENGIIYDPKGWIIPCNHMADHPIGKYGEDFADSEEMLQWLESFHVKRFFGIASSPPTVRCRDCPEWSSCGAGCRIFWIHKKPEVLIPVCSIGRVK